LVIPPRRTARGGGDRQPRFGHQLLTRLVHAHHRPLGVKVAVVDFQHILQGADELGVGLRRDHPLLLQPGLEVVFLSVRRTHSGLIESPPSSRTNWSANSFKVQWARPAGGWLQARATRRASWAPSSLRYCRPVGFLRNRAASQPSSTKAWRTRWTVDALLSTAWATAA